MTFNKRVPVPETDIGRLAPSAYKFHGIKVNIKRSHIMMVHTPYIGKST
jgi:hypothetical protein